LVISNFYSSSNSMQWSKKAENHFSFYMYPLARVIVAWRRPKLWAETSRSLLNIFKKCAGCNWRSFRSLWMIRQQGCSIRSLCHSCFKRPAYHHSQVISTYSDLRGHAEWHRDASILTTPTIVVSRLLGCDTLSLDEYFPKFRRHASLSRRKQAKNSHWEQRRASGGGSELNRVRSLCNDVTSKNTRTFINTAVRTSNRPTLTTVHTFSFVHRILCDLKLKWTSNKDNTAGRSQLRSLRG
jgi:hypothetical protein